MVKRSNGKIHKYLRIIFLYIPLSFIALTLFWVLVLKWIPVYITPLMVQRSIQYLDDRDFGTQKKWRSLDKISDQLVYAVVASEDNRFMEHSGFDFIEIQKSINDNKRGRKLRGASTISQQTAKNVFLIPSHSWIRKAFEAYFTIAIEKIWGKKRIMEVYLNVAEMGKGIYGAEAAAQHFFKKSANKLNANEASLLAAVLPNPIKRNAGNPSHYTKSRSSQIRNLMNKINRPVWEND